MSVRTNIVANLLGRAWGTSMTFLFVPLYIAFLGIEGYGLIGVFTAMMAVFALLDLGLSRTVNRELARLSAIEGSEADSRDLLRTLEIIYWSLGIVIGGSIALLAPLIAGRWLNTASLSTADAETAVRLMGGVAFFRWPVALYLGAMLGLRRQVAANAITAFGATLAAGGAVLVLWLISPTIIAFFAWQAVAALVQIVILVVATWRSLPEGHSARARFSLMRGSLGFSAGITGITLLSVVLTQLDKVVLTGRLPLAEFGHYALAMSIAGLLPTVAAAFETAVFPTLTRLVTQGDAAGERAMYHQASQSLAVLLMPMIVTLALFSPELLTAYLGRPDIVEGTHLLLSLLAVGSGLLAAMFMPLALQLAHGWTSLSLYKNVVAVILFVPLLFWLVTLFGAAGAAMSWMALTAGYVLVEVPVMHRRLLRGAHWRWYFVDMGLPLAVSIAVLGAARLAMPSGLSVGASLAWIGVAGLAALIGSGFASPSSRQAIRTISGRPRGRRADPSIATR